LSLGSFSELWTILALQLDANYHLNAQIAGLFGVVGAVSASCSRRLPGRSLIAGVLTPSSVSEAPSRCSQLSTTKRSCRPDSTGSIVEHAIIVDVEATPARTYDEVASTKTMIDRTEQRLDLKPDWLTADTAYGTGKLLAWLLGKSITPHIPVWERYPLSDGMFSRGEFTYDAERDVYVCPNGKLLRTSGTVHDSRVRNYLSQPQECRACALKQRCTRAPFKKIARDINEEARNHVRSLKGMPEFERSSNARKKVEMRFAHLKVQHGLERMRLRGLTVARDEFHLAATAQNLKTMALRLLGLPTGGVCASIA
jgi:hypothetical protein